MYFRRFGNNSMYKMINFDVKRENKRSQSELTIYSTQSVENTNNWLAWIRKKVIIKLLPKAIITYSNDRMVRVIFMKILMITFQGKKSNINSLNDLIADMISNKKLNPIVTELFIISRKLNIYLVFIM